MIAKMILDDWKKIHHKIKQKKVKSTQKPMIKPVITPITKEELTTWLMTKITIEPSKQPVVDLAINRYWDYMNNPTKYGLLQYVMNAFELDNNKSWRTAKTNAILDKQSLDKQKNLLNRMARTTEEELNDTSWAEGDWYGQFA
jgi:uncharacterized membrane-anchored protein YjiN (DUF445 family)